MHSIHSFQKACLFREEAEKMIPNYARLEHMLIKDEGRGKNGQMLYFCPAGKLTFGVGRNLEGRKEWFAQDELNHGKKHGIDSMVSFCLCHDAQVAHQAVCDLFGRDEIEWWHERRIHAVTNVMFCLGETVFRRFQNMIGAIRHNWWNDAAHHLLDSRWYRKYPERPGRLAREYMLAVDSDYED